MKYSAGKFYVTRSGRKAFISAIHLPNPGTGELRWLPLNGYIYVPAIIGVGGCDEFWREGIKWTVDGECYDGPYEHEMIRCEDWDLMA